MPILAAPYAAPLPASVQASWSGFQAMTWTGWDGSEWDLLNPASGTMLMSGGLRGLGMPPVTHYRRDSPAVAGTRWAGSRTEARESFWPLLVYSDAGSAAYAEYERAFWKTMHPDHTGVWSVTLPSGEVRSLRCRYADDGGQTFDVDPTRVGWSVYGITLTSEQPYWQGQAVTRTWKASSPVSFFGAGTGGPPFTISPGSTLAKASMNNDGDVEAFPMWVLVGPIDSASVGIAGKTTEYQASIAAGRAVVIDTDPDQQRVTEIAAPPDTLPVGSDEWSAWISNALASGTDRVLSLGKVAFNAPIPPGKSVGLSLAMSGAGTVTAAINPLYYRAL